MLLRRWFLVALAAVCLGLVATSASGQVSSPNFPAPGGYQPIPNFSGPGAGLQFRTAINDRFGGSQAISPKFVGLSFSNLPAEQDGLLVYCADCQQTVPCSGGGSGAWAFGQNGQWTCSAPNTPGDVFYSGASEVTGSLAINSLSGAGAAPTVSGFSVNGRINVEAYGAVGDATTGSTFSVTSGSNVVTIAIGAREKGCVSSRVGEYIEINGAGASGADLVSTISSCTDTTTAVIATSAGTTVTGTVGTMGRDDTSAVTGAISAAEASGKAVYFPAGKYLVQPGLTIATAPFDMYGDGPTLSSMVFERDVAGTPDGITVTAANGPSTQIHDLWFQTAPGGNGANDLTLSNANGVFVYHDWFDGGACNLNVVGGSDIWIEHNISEVSTNNYCVSGSANGPIRLLGNVSYHDNLGTGYLISDSAANHVIANNNYDTGSTSDGVLFNGASNIDFGTFTQNYSSVGGGGIYIQASHNISLHPVSIGNTGNASITIDGNSHDVTLRDPDVGSTAGEQLSLPLAANNVAPYNVNVTGFLDPNLVVNSALDGGAYWSVDGTNMPIVTGAGPHGGNAFVETGTGSTAPNAYDVTSVVIPVSVGQTVAFSGYIDATAVTSGDAQWCIGNQSGTLELCGTMAAGTKGRIAMNYTVPSSGVTGFTISAHNNALTASSGGKVVWANPKLEYGSFPTTYVATGPIDPSGNAALATVQNGCAGTVSLSSGAATVTNSCISTSRPIVCTDNTSTSGAGCSAVVSSGSLALHGNGSDTVSWAQF